LTQRAECEYTLRTVTFAQQLSAEIEKQGIPVKRLARLVAEDMGTRPESVRPLIYKYLRGEHEPDPPMREALARALGRGPDFFGRTLDPEVERTRFLSEQLIAHLRSRFEGTVA
jgi:transcriptional regulator with XRE-family HTH domain